MSLISRHSTKQQRRVELALAVGGFGLGTGEFASMGVLPDVAHTLSITIPVAGYTISSYALGVVVGAPVIAVLSASLNRKVLLLLLMALFTAGSLASAFSQGFSSLMVARFISGLPHGAFFGVASVVAASMAGVGQRAKAVGRVMMGLTISTLLGSPLATWLGQLAGWRSTYLLIGVCGLVTIVLLLLWMPGQKQAQVSNPLAELGALKKKQVWLALGIAAVGTGGLFSVFSYIAPTMTQLTGIPQAGVPFVMGIFGVGMILGNIVGSRMTDKSVMNTIAWSLGWVMVMQLAFFFFADIAWIAVPLVLAIGGSFALVPALQTRLMDVADDAQTLAASLNHSALNLANALGAWLGGMSVALGFGWSSTGMVGFILAVAGFGLFFWSKSLDSARSPAPLADS
ncbi:DHA1 family inner membrane transport protein [Erwinia toletana]|uniref:DHA1 family inner membrane transport protein n=1 Tax=Winslowiella toletana TaxID=92490 RepID=A0ABS4PE10_9GAMM|nr:MFS transporter [Winslowiella toletana]MBP2170869.1 DHA1 family inner membrane transport protein [Winslowiella toletana]